MKKFRKTTNISAAAGKGFQNMDHVIFAGGGKSVFAYATNTKIAALAEYSAENTEQGHDEVPASLLPQGEATIALDCGVMKCATDSGSERFDEYKGVHKLPPYAFGEGNIKAIKSPKGFLKLSARELAKLADAISRRGSDQVITILIPRHGEINNGPLAVIGDSGIGLIMPIMSRETLGENMARFNDVSERAGKAFSDR